MTRHTFPTVTQLAHQLIAAYERGETCPPATAAALREVLPPSPSCPPGCPYAPANARRAHSYKPRTLDPCRESFLQQA
jgi:hypothetical protein